MSRPVLQKLLHAGMSAAIRERGYDQAGGFVVQAASRENRIHRVRNVPF